MPVRAVGDPLLDATLGRIGAKRRPRRLKYWVSALVERRGKVLWLFRTTRYEIVVHAALDETVGPLREVLLGRLSTVTPEVTALVALVSVTGLVDRIVPAPYVREARRRAKAIAKGDLGGQAVSEVVDEALAAIAVVIAAGAVVSR